MPSLLERLCRYGARPALALDRLSRLPDGRFAYRMKYPFHGHTHRILTGMELMARLSSVIPPPRHPLVRYTGVLAPGSPWRKHVVPAHPPARRCCAEHERERKETQQAAAVPAPTSGSDAASAPLDGKDVRHGHDDVLAKHASSAASATAAAAHWTSPLDLTHGPLLATPTQSPDATRTDWASLLRHGLELDALVCTRCGGRMRMLSAVLDPVQVRRILSHLGERTSKRVPSRAWDPLPADGWASGDPDPLATDRN